MAKNRRHGQGSVYQRGNIWWIKYHRDGEPFYESSHSDQRLDAERFLRKKLAEITLDQFSSPKAKQLRIEELLADQAEGLENKQA